MLVSAIFRVFYHRRKQQFKTATTGECHGRFGSLSAEFITGAAARHVRAELNRLVSTVPDPSLQKVGSSDSAGQRYNDARHAADVCY